MGVGKKTAQNAPKRMNGRPMNVKSNVKKVALHFRQKAKNKAFQSRALRAVRQRNAFFFNCQPFWRFNGLKGFICAFKSK